MIEKEGFKEYLDKSMRDLRDKKGKEKKDSKGSYEGLTSSADFMGKIRGIKN